MSVAAECEKEQLVAAGPSLIKEKHTKLRSFRMPGVYVGQLEQNCEVSSLDVVSCYIS